jgi:hypothetical protein
VTRVMISAQMAGADCGVDIAGIRSRDFIRIRLAVGLGGSLAMGARSRLVVGIPIGTLKMRETYRSFGDWAALASSLARATGSKRGRPGSHCWAVVKPWMAASRLPLRAWASLLARRLGAAARSRAVAHDKVFSSANISMITVLSNGNESCTVAQTTAVSTCQYSCTKISFMPATAFQGISE